MRFSSRFGLALLCVAAIFILSLDPVSADGPADNHAENVRRIPKLGVEVSDEDRALLNSGLNELQSMIEQIQGGQESAATLLPDVEIYYRAVRDTLEYQEFFDPREVKAASNLLMTGKSRAAALLMGKAPWRTQTGAVIRGYVQQKSPDEWSEKIAKKLSKEKTQYRTSEIDYWQVINDDPMRCCYLSSHTDKSGRGLTIVHILLPFLRSE